MVGDIDTSPLDAGYNSELPGSGVRIINSGLEEPEVNAKTTREGKIEPHITSDATPDATSEVMSSVADTKLTGDNIHDESLPSSGEGGGVIVPEEPLTADVNSRIEPETSNKSSKIAPHESPVKKTSVKHVVKAGRANQTKTNKALKNSEADQLVIVLNVHSQEGSFPGVEIKKLLEACGLDHGEMSIFHRHEEDDLLSPIQFSVANAVEPGYFDPDTLDEIATPGVSFFMSLPGPKDYMKAFDYMLETAQCFARNLKGDLKDQDRSIMTVQTIEHCRQQVKEFERKQLSKSRV
jgi:cell division protein ZipA